MELVYGVPPARIGKVYPLLFLIYVGMYYVYVTNAPLLYLLKCNVKVFLYRKGVYTCTQAIVTIYATRSVCALT